MSSLRKLVLSLAVGWSALSPFGFFALAQEGPKPQAARQQGKVSDTELKAFVRAYVEYRQIQQQYGPAVIKAKEPEKKKIQDEANAQVAAALAKQNLTAEDYNRIFKLVNGDERLRKKALKLVQEERKRS
jgi:hypothetical protein